MNHSTDLLTTYSMPLIILAFVIAACSSFCALELVDLVKGSRAQTRRLWLWAGAASFGLGTWAMHFIGMLAFDMQMPIGYHLPTVLFSMLPVMAAAAFALSLAASEHLTKQRLFGGAVLLGVGIGGMHYSGMFAMRMEAAMYFDPKFLVISVLFAVGASLFALYSAFGYALGQMMGRDIARHVPPTVMAFHQNIVYLAVAAVLVAVSYSFDFSGVTHKSLSFLLRQWVMPAWPDLLLMCLLGAMASCGMILFGTAYKLAESSFVAPFEYSSMIWAVLFGFLLFGDIPGLHTVAGGVIVVSAGLFMLWMDRARDRRQPQGA